MNVQEAWTILRKNRSHLADHHVMDVHEGATVVLSLNEEVIANALEEMDPKLQVAIMGASNLKTI